MVFLDIGKFSLDSLCIMHSVVYLDGIGRICDFIRLCYFTFRVVIREYF